MVQHENDKLTNNTVETLSQDAEKYLLCKTLIRDACLSRLEIKFKKDIKSLEKYERFYSKYGIRIYYFLTIINLLTIIIENPTPITIYGHPIPFYIPITINLICQAYFYYRWYLVFTVFDKQVFFHHFSPQMTILILFMMTLNVVTTIYFNLVRNNQTNCFRWNRALRPLLLLTFPENRRLRAAFENLKNTAYDIVPVLGLMTASILFMSIVSVTLLDDYNLKYPDGQLYFKNFFDVVWDIYVLSTTANSPDVIVPAYEANHIYILIYIIVCIVSNWLFVGILTASVYNSYKSHLGDFVTRTIAKRKKKLDEVFDLASESKCNNQKGITYNTFIDLMQSANLNRTPDLLRVIFHILDKNRSGFLNKVEFARLSEYMQAQVVEVELSRVYFSQYLPKFRFYSSPKFQICRKWMEHSVVMFFFRFMIVANGFTAILFRHNKQLQHALEWAFFFIFSIELVVRYLVCGGVRFFKNRWNLFDIVLVFGAFIGDILYDLLSTININLPHGIIQLLFLFRLFRLLKLLSSINAFRVVIGCILTILPSLTAYTCMLLIFYYILTCIGIEFFEGIYSPPANNTYVANLTSCNNPHLINTDFVNWHYCLFNFNSALDSFLLLLIITVGNNWHVFVNAFVETTNRWTRIFFLVIHWVCALIVLNVVLAFIIEAFLIEFDSHETKFELYMKERLNELGMDAETELRKRGIDNFDQDNFIITEQLLDQAFPIAQESEDPNCRRKAFYLKSDNASIEILMFRMFEKEIEELVNQFASQKKHSLYKVHDRYALNS